MLSISGDAVSRLFRRVIARYPKTENRVKGGAGFAAVGPAGNRSADYPVEDLISRLEAVTAASLETSDKAILAQALAECEARPLNTGISPFRYTIA